MMDERDKGLLAENRGRLKMLATRVPMGLYLRLVAFSNETGITIETVVAEALIARLTGYREDLERPAA